ncbi:MAG: PQQ-binding-like beta-propeller repeat protein [Candidatus Bathyarchaeia archaeon]
MRRKRLYTMLALVLLTGIMVLVFLGAFNVAKANNQSSDSNGDPNTWSMFRNNLSHTGYTSSTAPTTNMLKWSYRIGGGVESSPAVVNGVVYVGSNWGDFCAFNASTGHKIWDYVRGGGGFSSPAVANGVVYVGSTDDNVYALNASTGSFIWSYPTGDEVMSSPAVSNGVVYVGSWDDNVYALNATTGGEIWSYTTGDRVYSSPAVVSGVVYVGSDDGNLYALNATTGNIIWSHFNDDTVDWVASSPVVSNGVVYTASYFHGYVYALNASTGNEIWSCTLDGGVFSSPAVVGDVLYVGGSYGNVYALNASTGGQIWSFFAGNSVWSSPAVADGIVYIGSENSNVYALNASTGSPIWNYQTNAVVDSSPAVADGVVYIGSDDGNVYAFGTPNYSASALFSSINQGQTDLLTSSATSGDWFVYPPRSEGYEEIYDSSPASYVFNSSGAPLGTWRFEIQSTDDTGAITYSNVVTVTVNRALAAPTVSALANPIDQGQSSVLISSAMSTGAPPYSYQWFSEAPSASGFSPIQGATSANYMFDSTGATLGTWSFNLQVNDSTGVSVTSNTATVVVNAAAPSVDAWSMFHHDLSHSGYSTYAGPTTNTVKWSFYTTGDSVESSPTVVNGVVYVGSGCGYVYALDATTGNQIWNFSTGGWVESSPAVVDGVVYIGSEDGNVYALNAANGNQLWNYTTGGGVDSSPRVVNGVVYIGSGDSNVYALNASTGSMIWSYTTGGGVWSSPAVVNGVVYVGSFDGNVYALNASTGAYIWSDATGGLVRSSPVVVGGVVYVGSFDDNVYAFNATTGARIWISATFGCIVSSPAVDGGVVYVGSEDGNVYALNAANGDQLWSYTTDGRVISSPDVANGVVYVGSDDGNLYALNATDGNPLWSYTTGGVVWSSPAVVGGVVYIGSEANYVYALNATTGTQIWSCFIGGSVDSSPTVAGGMVYVGSYDDKVYALDAATGDIMWSYPTSGPVWSSPAVAGGVVYVGSDDGCVYALNATTGSQIWSYQTGDWVESSPAVVGGVVYVGSGNGNVYALNSANGDQLWSYTTGSGVYSSPAVVGGVVYVGSSDGNVYALDAANGNQLWSYTTGSGVNSSPAVVGGVVYVGSSDGNVYALDAATGSQIWSYSTGSWIGSSSPAVAGGVVYIGSVGGTVYALNAANGNQLWNYTTVRWVESSPAIAGGVVYIGSGDGYVYAFGSSTLTAPTVSASPTTVDCGQTSSLTSSAVTTGTSPYSYQWFEMAPDGTYVAVGTNSASFNFATDGSTAAGSWNFILQVTDSTDAAVNSTAVSVTVNASLYAPVVNPAGPVDQGQTAVVYATLSGGGTAPITYEWFEKAPDGNYVAEGSGDAPGLFYFATSGSTATGSYSFILQLSDATGAAVNSTARSVTVNAALVPPTVTPSFGTVDRGQTSVLSSSSVTSGTSPYTYQWFEKDPSGNYVAVGTNSAGFSFSTTGSTATGVYLFVLQVTDATNAAVNSTAVSVTVNASPTVTVSGSPSPGTIGVPVTFTAVGSGGTGTLTYNWYIGYTEVQSGSSNTYTATPTSSGSFSVNVSVTDSLTETSNQVTGSVYVNPSVTYNFASLSSSTIDYGGSVTDAVTLELGLTGPVASGATGSVTFYWSTDDATWNQFDVETLVDGSATSAAFVPAASGTYYIEAAYPGDSNYLPSSSTSDLTVNSAPSASISPGSWTMDVGQSTTFTATASGGSGTYTNYQWYANGLLAQSGSASTMTWGSPNAGTFLITVKVTDSYGVTSVLSSAATVTVNSALTAPTVTATPATVDRGQTSALTSTAVSTGTGPYTYQWLEKVPGGSYVDVGSNSASFNFVTSQSTTTGTWSFILQVTDSTGAAVNSTAATDLVNPALAAPTVTPSPSTVDQGQTSALSSSAVTTGTSPYAYQWFEKAPGGSYVIVGANSAGFSFATTSATATGSWNFMLQVTDNADTAVNSTAVAVAVNVDPTVSISPTVPLTLDVGQPQTFTATSSGGTGTLSYQWFLDGSAVSGATGTSYTFTPSSTNSASIYATATDSLDVTSATSNTVSVSVNQLTVDASVSGSNGAISPSGSVPVNYGGTQVFTITPNTGYQIASITVNGGSVPVTSPSGQTVSVTNVQGADTISATFTLAPVSTPTTTPTATPSPSPTPTTTPTVSPTSSPTASSPFSSSLVIPVVGGVVVASLIIAAVATGAGKAFLAKLSETILQRLRHIFKIGKASISVPKGVNITVHPHPDVQLIFSEVTKAGAAKATPLTSYPSLPHGESFIKGTVFDIKTSAAFTGKATVGIHFDGSGLNDAQKMALKVFRIHSASVWEDITTHIDLKNNIAYGATDHFSIFGVR